MGLFTASTEHVFNNPAVYLEIVDGVEVALQPSTEYWHGMTYGSVLV